MGLKETAPLAGFSWRADDGGGTLAIVKYEQATDEESGPAARAAAQEWILEYNEDDVRATAALRSGSTGRRGICRRLRRRKAEIWFTPTQPVVGDWLVEGRPLK